MWFLADSSLRLSEQALRMGDRVGVLFRCRPALHGKSSFRSLRLPGLTLQLRWLGSWERQLQIDHGPKTSAKHAVTMPEELLRSRAALNICRFSRSHHVAPATDMALRRLPCTQRPGSERATAKLTDDARLLRTLWALAALSAVPFCQGDCLVGPQSDVSATRTN